MPIQPIASKVGREGQYLPYKGVTIVSAIDSGSDPFWYKLNEGLNQSSLIKRYYSLLPLSSYHMTTTNLFQEQGLPSEEKSMRDFIDFRLSWFKRVSEALEADRFYPQVTVQNSSARSVIVLSLRLENVQASKISDIAGKFGQQSKIPNPLHVTLAYLYKELPLETQIEIEQELKRILRESLSDQSQVFTLKAPKLCFFQDMTAFIPWDGLFNPF
jgi:hypothetical protein